MDRHDYGALLMAGLFLISTLLMAHFCFRPIHWFVAEPEPSAMYVPEPVKASERPEKALTPYESANDLLSLMEAFSG